ncbi:MAG: imidazole glycerol phosphate synthase subunit HisH [Lachnospiraceae bacterium]|nr:imidazole glycerol phosphate synthase subunit HisH [Lachnospiraceae bacterium]
MIAIIDYDAGNLKSVEKAFAALGLEAIATRDHKEILQADQVVLPGVGSFGNSMDQLRKYELDKVIGEVVEKHTPFLGICLGLQLLFEGSEESKGVEGLGILEGEIVKIPDKPGLKIPHMGWNSLSFPRPGRLFEGIEEGVYVYFVHSYYLKAREESIVRAVTEYSTALPVSVEKNQVFACQFHPEKSSSMGLKMLQNFARTGGDDKCLPKD